MKLRLPLREPVELVTTLGPGGATGQTVPYGTSSTVRGRLLDASGRPIAGQEIVVVDRFDNGALFPTAERPAITDEQGPLPHAGAGRADALHRGAVRRHDAISTDGR